MSVFEHIYPRPSRRPLRDYAVPAARYARAFWYVRPGVGMLHDDELPERSASDCLIHTRFSAISPGTERIVATGQVPHALLDDMRCPYMGGEFTFPVKYGYSLVGEVEEGPPDFEGRLVHVLHPHQDAAVVKSADVQLIPGTVPPWRATLLSNMETAINAVWDSDLRLGDSALVIGFGVIGSLVARLVSWMPGVDVDIVDVSAAKLELAQRMGFHVRRTAELPEDYDIAFHASGSTSGLQTAIDHIGFEGQVVELSWYGTQPVHLRLGETFHSRRKSIISSQVSTVAASRRPRWDTARRKRLALRLLENPHWDEHLTRTLPFADLPAFTRELAAGSSDFLSVLVDYDGGGA